MCEFRFVITPFCNYKCFFCHSESIEDEISLLLKPSDYEFLAKIAKEKLSWNTCTITGGEPLISPIFMDVTEKIWQLGIKTTVISNASLLARPGETLKYVDQINISLHTMNPSVYKTITGCNYPLQSILNTAVIARSQLPNLKIHLNYTVIKGLNDSDADIEALFVFARSIRAVAKFIDLSTTDKKIETNASDILKQLVGLGFRVKKETNWQYFLERGGGDTARITKCPFNGRYMDLPARDVFVEPDGTFYTSYGMGGRINAFDDIRKRDVFGVIEKINNLIF